MGKVLALLIVLSTLMTAALAVRLYLFLSPCRLEADCRGYGLDTEYLKQWEEQEKNRKTGILAVSGWQPQPQREITSVSTGRKTQAHLFGVYGSMELVFPAALLAGNYGLAGKKEACVLTQDLAEALFGSSDVVGETVKFAMDEKGQETHLEVAGVIDKKGQYLLMPIEEGEIEKVAVLYERRYKAREKLKEQLPFFSP
ncbi:hypothetical protein D3Z51_00460 [Clostridiaceae bacterium]|nr:hypothetical protein [Clostridiaceae bacterium]RKI16490.1 hypothetical protein D7V81_04450 [bacterium 1XD21-70]